MQWMAMTSLVPYHAPHSPQHSAASPFGPLNKAEVTTKTVDIVVVHLITYRID